MRQQVNHPNALHARECARASRGYQQGCAPGALSGYMPVKSPGPYPPRYTSGRCRASIWMTSAPMSPSNCVARANAALVRIQVEEQCTGLRGRHWPSGRGQGVWWGRPGAVQPSRRRHQSWPVIWYRRDQQHPYRIILSRHGQRVIELLTHNATLGLEHFWSVDGYGSNCLLLFQ
jgi:hypothetical protein